MARITHGEAVALFAFDIGYAVRLDELERHVPSLPLEAFTRKKQTPQYFQYTKPPRVIDLGPALPLAGRVGTVRGLVFDFGAVSISYHWALPDSGEPIELEELPEISQSLYGLDLESDARRRLLKLMELISPAVERAAVSDLVEDYYIFILAGLSEPLEAAGLCERYGPTLAQTLRADTRPLSKQQATDLLAQSISYYTDDLTLVDWNAAVIYDRDYWDTVNVLELLNVELLEARYVDAELDKRIDDYAGLAHRPARFPIPLRNPYAQAIEELAELRIFASLLSERVDNALKLVGDLYLARVHNTASARLHLAEWDTTISRKLAIVDGLYEVLTDRVRSAQGQTLEIIVIALIFFEILMALLAGK